MIFYSDTMQDLKVAKLTISKQLFGYYVDAKINDLDIDAKNYYNKTHPHVCHQGFNKLFYCTKAWKFNIMDIDKKEVVKVIDKHNEPIYRMVEQGNFLIGLGQSSYFIWDQEKDYKRIISQEAPNMKGSKLHSTKTQLFLVNSSITEDQVLAFDIKMPYSTVRELDAPINNISFLPVTSEILLLLN